MNMNGKVAIVTGAARGIGLACAEAFARSGAITILSDINNAGSNQSKLRRNQKQCCQPPFFITR